MSNDDVAPVWYDPSSNRSELKQQIRGSLAKFYNVRLPEKVHIHVDHQQLTITLVDPRETAPKETPTVVHVDQDLLASIRI